MNISPDNKSPDATVLAADEIRWHGHMADDVGATFGPEPLAFLSATPAALLLSGNRGKFLFPREAVRKLGRGNLYPWFFSAVRIHHRVPGFPADLQFKPLGGVRPAEVIARLHELGYPVR